MFCTAWRGLSKADLHGSGVGFEAFGSCQCGDCGSQFSKCLAIQLLDRDDLDVVGGGESSTQSGHAVGGEDVIGPGGVVSRSFDTVRAYEYAACVADFRDKFGMMNAQVLGREGVREFGRFIERI